MKKFDTFLIDKRFRESKALPEDSRNPFENDFTRVIFSSSFRRLQDKTQVFQLDKGDFVRTRLTHSMEVSSLGRSIGLTLENLLIKKELLSKDRVGMIPSILATAGLVHDLGNPPFGHFGEATIQTFFKKLFKENRAITEQLTKEEQADLENFDGNVQTFRVLRKLHFIKDRDGMNMTFSVLATIIKYPFNSIDGNKRKSGSLINKKFGYFQSEKDDFEKIWSTFPTKGRYPLTYLLESADDIAYSAADIEDACKKGIITAEDIRSFLKESLVNVMLSDEEREADFISLFDKLYDSVSSSYKNRLDLTVQQFRIHTQRFMIHAAIKEFMDNYDAIIEGTYNKDLLENSYASNIRNAFKLIGDKIFSHKSIIENEIIGHTVLNDLLDKFVNASLCEGENGTLIDRQLYSLISSNYQFIYENFSKRGIYDRLQLAVDYISGMTDNYALNKYRKFNGIG